MPAGGLEAATLGEEFTEDERVAHCRKHMAHKELTRWPAVSMPDCRYTPGLHPNDGGCHQEALGFVVISGGLAAFRNPYTQH